MNYNFILKHYTFNVHLFMWFSTTVSRIIFKYISIRKSLLLRRNMSFHIHFIRRFLPSSRRIIDNNPILPESILKFNFRMYTTLIICRIILKDNIIRILLLLFSSTFLGIHIIRINTPISIRTMNSDFLVFKSFIGEFILFQFIHIIVIKICSV